MKFSHRMVDKNNGTSVVFISHSKKVAGWTGVEKRSI